MGLVLQVRDAGQQKPFGLETGAIYLPRVGKYLRFWGDKCITYSNGHFLFFLQISPLDYLVLSIPTTSRKPTIMAFSCGI